VNALCELFGIHRSSYRAWRDRPRGVSVEERQLCEKIKAAHALQWLGGCTQYREDGNNGWHSAE